MMKSTLDIYFERSEERLLSEKSKVTNTESKEAEWNSSENEEPIARRGMGARIQEKLNAEAVSKYKGFENTVNGEMTSVEYKMNWHTMENTVKE